MAFADTAPIGASVIDYMERKENANKEPSAAALANDEHDDETLSCQSIIPYSEKSCNILLRGPRSSASFEQGSLVMNMAHSIACRYQQEESIHHSSEEETSPCVAILKPALFHNNNNNNKEEEIFPLSCQLVESSPPPLDFYSRLRALQQEPNVTRKKSSCWNMPALRRIQVHRVMSMAHVLEFLLSIPTSNTCTRGIFVQDLDILVRGNHNNTHGGDWTTAQLMTMTQICKYCMSWDFIYEKLDINLIHSFFLFCIVALLADTAHVIRSATNSPCTVMVTMSNDTGIPPNVLRIWSRWFPTRFQINIPTIQWQWKQEVPLDNTEEEVVESQFALVQQHSPNKDSTTSSSSGMVDRTTTTMTATPVALYAIVRHQNGSSRIVWKQACS